MFVFGRMGATNQQSKKTTQTEPQLAASMNKTVFVFKDGKLTDATKSALLFVGAPVDQNAVWQVLVEKLETNYPDVKPALKDLQDNAVRFDLQGIDYNWLKGRNFAGRVELEICTAKPDALRPLADGENFMGAITELSFLREIIDLSPTLIWQVAKDGSITWVNRAYTETAPFTQILKAGDPLAQRSKRQSLKFPDSSKPQWFETKSFSQNDGQMLCFAFPADPVVQAEQALGNFVQTLTKTFAHLPIGLAIFDRNRQLALFNPALADLTTLEPEWLTARPTLTSFLDRLREKRHVPEPKNYKTWRDRIAALERAAEDGTYEENWPLPTGQTYHVTGRPHPEGAVAFLFEDITSSISLQREYRAELELGQSVIDSQPGAIAVFKTNGDLVMSNDSFAMLWGIDPREMLGRLDINETVKIWQAACEANPIWTDLIAFAAHTQERVKWSGQVQLKTGLALRMRVKPLSQGALLCEFTHEPTIVAQPSRKSMAKRATDALN